MTPSYGTRNRLLPRPHQTTRQLSQNPVFEEGYNFLLGQHQLIALARALVRTSRIIVGDEATSSIDEETEREIKQSMAMGFKERTVLCIAHRLQTFLNYDRIAVIDSGRIAESGPPLELRGTEEILFRGMCDTGKLGRASFR